MNDLHDGSFSLLAFKGVSEQLMDAFQRGYPKIVINGNTEAPAERYQRIVLLPPR
jgi:hypothetical protein